jgi:hypothetical protein
LFLLGWFHMIQCIKNTFESLKFKPHVFYHLGNPFQANHFFLPTHPITCTEWQQNREGFKTGGRGQQQQTL